MTKTEKVIKGLEICAGGTNSCTPCPFKDNCKGTSNAAMAAAIKLLKAQEAQGWISVKDRLPEVDKSVIVFARGKNNPIYKIAIASMSNKNVFDVRLETELYWREPWQFFNTNYEITHWMPLPEPPKE